ncbi:MAG: hypothetical protein IT162_04130 [Bryobacterales bacterium]|nr:hypothetical protein [Bryobacterales bacterium]
MHNTPSSNINVIYSPAFSRSPSLSGYRAINHALGVSYGRRLGARWHLAASSNVVALNFQQSLTGTSPTAQLTGIPSTFEELSTLVLTGKTENPFLTAAARVTPAVTAPEQAYLFGGNHLSVANSVSIGFDKSTRSMFRFGAFANRTQLLGDQTSFFYSDRPLDPQLRRTTNISGVAGWTYMLEPRTTLSTDFSTSRIMSDFQDAYVSQVSVSVGRKLSERWFAKGSLGMGWFSPTRSTFRQDPFRRHEWGASLGYKVYSHTFMGSYTSQISDQFGLGANSNISSAAAWSWRRPGSSFSVASSFGYSQMVGPSFPNSGSWSGFVTVGRALNSHTSLSVSYRALQFPQTVFFYSPTNTVHGVTTSVSWSPARIH